MVMLGLGLAVGGGVVHTAWVMRNTGRTTAPEISAKQSPDHPHGGRSRSGPARTARGSASTEEKARLLAIRDPMEAWRQSQTITDLADAPPS